MNSGSFGTGAGYWGNPNKGPSGAGPNPNRQQMPQGDLVITNQSMYVQSVVRLI